MADETNIRIGVTTNGSVVFEQGEAGTGSPTRRVRLRAVPDEGYRFERWVITKTLPFFATGQGPYNNIQDACAQRNILTGGDTYLFYEKNGKLYVDEFGEREAPFGYYYLVSSANGYRPEPNTYIEYTGNFIPVPAECPPPSGPGGGLI